MNYRMNSFDDSQHLIYRGQRFELKSDDNIADIQDMIAWHEQMEAEAIIDQLLDEL